MTRRKDKHRRSPEKAENGGARTPKPQDSHLPRVEPVTSGTSRAQILGRGGVYALGGIVVALLFTALYFIATHHRAAPPAAASSQPGRSATYVGSTVCGGCHAQALAAWQGSQHERAMQVATAATVLGDFAGDHFTAGRVTSTFTESGGKFVVRTDGPDGKLADYPIAYTFGVYPLQQYLIEFPRGRMQALGIAWDTRPKAEGGARWFQLYADPPVPGDPLHWTGIDQNWNYQCADCHSTDVRKGYDAQSSSFHTTWSELSVGCEACHGPGSKHVAWAQRASSTDRQDKDPSHGLVVALDERADVHWIIGAATGNAARSHPRTTNREIETCARCHSRRGQFADGWDPGMSFGEAYRLALLSPDLYYPDGQQRDEVYSYASFLQSRMYAMGVTCADCHDPHTSQLRAEGNGVCAQCHAAAKYDTPAHTHHKAASAGGQCAACHMPTTTYMRVDPRHDHSLRIPRPDRTVAFGAPNACNGCHEHRSAQWAATLLVQWFPHAKPGFQSFADAFVAADRHRAGADAALMRIIEDSAQPAIVRASALQRLGRLPNSMVPPTLSNSLDDPNYLVRAATVGVFESADSLLRAQLLARLLNDPVRLVRMDAARALAGDPQAHLEAKDRPAFERALGEYVAAQRFDADRPEAQAALGDLYATEGHITEAVQAYEKALALDPTFAPAALNLADLERSQGKDAEAEGTIRALIERVPNSGSAHYALGLTLVREKRYPEALSELERAAALAPDETRFTYVYAVALNDTGRPTDALKELRAALARHPDDETLLLALATYEHAAGQLDAARGHVQHLLALDPNDAEAVRLAAELGIPSH